MALHLGILQTDNVLEQFQPDHGDYPAMFERVFRAVEPDAQFSHYPVQQGVPAQIDCDAYLITGSRHSVYDDLPWIPPLVDFLGEVLAAQRKIVGVCFGHQLMAHHFGGRVAPAARGWTVGVHRSHVVQPQAWMAGGQRDVVLLSSHKDQVVSLPPEAQLYLSNESCPISGFTMGDQVITVQGHPEFTKDYARELLAMRRELLGEDTYARALDSMTEQTTEQSVAQWFVEFVRNSR